MWSWLSHSSHGDLSDANLDMSLLCNAPRCPGPTLFRMTYGALLDLVLVTWSLAPHCLPSTNPNTPLGPGFPGCSCTLSPPSLGNELPPLPGTPASLLSPPPPGHFLRILFVPRQMSLPPGGFLWTPLLYSWIYPTKIQDAPQKNCLRVRGGVAINYSPIGKKVK